MFFSELHPLTLLQPSRKSRSDTPASLKGRCEYHLHVSYKSPLSLSEYYASHSYPSFVVFRSAQHWLHLRPPIPSRLLSRSRIPRPTFRSFRSRACPHHTRSGASWSLVGGAGDACCILDPASRTFLLVLINISIQLDGKGSGRTSEHQAVFARRGCERGACANRMCPTQFRDDDVRPPPALREKGFISFPEFRLFSVEDIVA
jgi:hypothetical protein